MKILYIDRSFVTSRGMLSVMLSLTKGIALVEHLKGFQEAGRVCRTKEVDALIFNVDSLSDQGIPFLRRLPKQWPRIRVYGMLSSIDRVSVEYLRGCSNICGVFSVNTDLKNFHEILQRPWRKNITYFSPEIEEHLFDPGMNNLLEDKLGLFEQLSRREYDVLMLSLEGDRNTDIARKLNISPKTVCTHRCHIREKFSVRNMQEIYKIVLEIRHNSTSVREHLKMLRNESSDLSLTHSPVVAEGVGNALPNSGEHKTSPA